MSAKLSYGHKTLYGFFINTLSIYSWSKVHPLIDDQVQAHDQMQRHCAESCVDDLRAMSNGNTHLDLVPAIDCTFFAILCVLSRQTRATI